MSLRHALLGLLADGPRSGYELSKTFDDGLAEYAWHASHSQIYPELRKMVADGLIEVVDEGARGRRSYATTPDGRAELRSWMMTAPAAGPVRNEAVLRLFLLSALDQPDAMRLLDAMIESCAREAERLSRSIADMDAQIEPGSGPTFGRYAAEFGYRIYQLQVDWATWARGELTNDVDHK